jgi:nitroimidazol reductase NimA-like FMN-containing flavoprotein (pyridoxamine 5'-phosphate oxidase superfamily)
MARDAPTIRRTSAWTAGGIDQFLRDARIPVRLGCLGAGGAPLLCSLWYIWDQDAVWCATQRSARVVSWLRADPRCAFEVAGDDPPYRGVRGQGEAVLLDHEGPAVLGRLIDRYLGTRESEFARWLLERRKEEVAIRIRPAWMTAWDYTRRMGVRTDR